MWGLIELEFGVGLTYEDNVLWFKDLDLGHDGVTTKAVWSPAAKCAVDKDVVGKVVSFLLTPSVVLPYSKFGLSGTGQGTGCGHSPPC